MAKKEYEVGYKKPPTGHQFKKGQSGNPAGRSPKAKKQIGGHPFDNSLHQAWLDEANKEVTVVINGRRVRRTMGHLVIERTLADAAAGKPTALRIAHQRFAESERILRDRWIQRVDVDVFLWQKAKAELEQKLAAGETEPVVIPHPDDFIFDKVTNSPRLVGPIDEEEYKAAMVIAKQCDTLTKVFESANFKEAEDPRRLRFIARLSELNEYLPLRLKRWPEPRFPEDYERLFPEEVVLARIIERELDASSQNAALDRNSDRDGPEKP
jgi:hypothetical protein